MFKNRRILFDGHARSGEMMGGQAQRQAAVILVIELRGEGDRQHLQSGEHLNDEKDDIGDQEEVEG